MAVVPFGDTAMPLAVRRGQLGHGDGARSADRSTGGGDLPGSAQHAAPAHTGPDGSHVVSRHDPPRVQWTRQA
jgi:hypothetical protein